MILLIKLCVVAASLCDDRLKFLTHMQELGQGTQKVLMETLQEAQNQGRGRGEHNEDEKELEEGEDDDEEYTEEDTNTQSTSLAQQARNEQSNPQGSISDLAFEERLAKIIADNQRIAHEKRNLQRHIGDLNTQYANLQELFDKGQDELTEANERLTAVLSGRAGGSMAQETKNEAIITSLEARIAEADAAVDELRKSNEILRLKAERAQKLQDDYDEIKIERDKLSRKANAAEKYRQKLEVSQEMEKENTILKTKVGELQAQLRQSDSRTASSSDLQREIDEYRRLLPSIEQERHELNEMKKRLELDYHMLQARYSDSEEQLRRSKQEVEDLQGQIRDYDDGTELGASHGHGNEDRTDTAAAFEDTDLENEEANFTAAEARLSEALFGDMNDKAESSTLSIAKGNGEVDFPFEENGISEDELRAIMAAMRAQMHAGTAVERESGVRMQKKLIIMLEKLRTRDEALVEHIKKQSHLIAELKTQQPQEMPKNSTEKENEANRRSQESAAKSDTELEQQLEDQDVMIENLKREIRLISSAWYEQNQRLATLGAGSGGGAVALMRSKARSGIEEPRSFLGRQRKMLDKATVGK